MEKELQEMFRRLTGEYIRGLSQPSSFSQRRRKKRKKKLPKTSSCARRRHRQWHVPGWLSGYDAIHAVFPLVRCSASWPVCTRRTVALIVDSCSDMCKARFARFTACFVFPVVVGRPAGRSVCFKKNNYAVYWFYW